MEKIVNALSWVSYVIVFITIAIVSLYTAFAVGGYLNDLLALTGWQCLLVMPVVFLVGICVCIFLMLGCTKVRLK